MQSHIDICPTCFNVSWNKIEGSLYGLPWKCKGVSPKGPSINYVSMAEGGRGSPNAHGCSREGGGYIWNAYVSI